MNIRKYKLVAVLMLAFLFFSFFVNVVSAAGIWDNLGPCQQNGSCTLNDFVQLGVNVANWILGIVGSLALLMFMYGGLMFILAGQSILTEGGKSSKINKGKDILKNAVIGLVIVFTSWIVINFAVSVLTGGTTIFGQPWFQTPR